MTTPARPPSRQDMILAIYEAALEPQRWVEFAALARSYLGLSRCLSLCVSDRAAPQAGLTLSDGCDEKADRDYFGHYYRCDPGSLWRKALPVGTVTATNQHMSDRQLEETEYYNDFARPLDIFHQIGVQFERSQGRFGGLGGARPRGAPDFTAQEVRNLAALVPHLRQALEVSRRVGAEQAARAALDALLERCACAVFLLDAGGAVAFMNGQAEALARARDGLELTARGVSAASHSAQRELLRLVRAAVQTGSGNGSEAGGALAVPRPSGREPYRVLVSPLCVPQRLMDAGGQGLAAAVFVADPDADPALPAEHLRRWFGLTPAEARVAKAFVAGMSPEEIAAASATATGTVRAQLRAIYQKTGVSRQSQLVKKVLTSPLVPHRRPATGTGK